MRRKAQSKKSEFQFLVLAFAWIIGELKQICNFIGESLRVPFINLNKVQFMTMPFAYELRT